MLAAYLATGLFFMLLPGTLFGVAQLLTISASHTPAAADAGWVQAHGHAQIFGWLGTFILGIGYYAIPRLRSAAWSPLAAWSTYVLWTAGVTMRWAVGTWPWHWRILFPLSGALELAAVVVFCASVFLARSGAQDQKWRTSIIMITAGGCGMAVAGGLGAWQSFLVAGSGDAPLFSFEFNQRYLVLVTWGFIVPFIWGFSTRWLPPLLGLRKTLRSLLVPALAVLGIGVVTALTGAPLLASVLLLVSAMLFVLALRLWQPADREPKLRGVHASTPWFLRLAYGWLVVAALLAVASASEPLPNGWAGASRHALTVGFFTVVVFAIGPRVLPSFLGVGSIWSPRLMAAVLLLANVGCSLRVVSQVLAYEGISQTAWSLLPVSALIEMFAVGGFVLNMMMTFTTGSRAEFVEDLQGEAGLVVQS